MRPARTEHSYRLNGPCPAPAARWFALRWGQSLKENNMPVILWLLGVPLGIVLLLVLLGVF
jgi:hypothetical protein